MTASGSVGTFLQPVLVDASDELFATELAALADEPDGVHQQRVRVRRLRSILAGYREVLDTRAAERVRVAYAEWGHELGVVRDLEVRADVAVELLERAGIDDAQIRARLVDSERDAYSQAHARLVERAAEPRARARAAMLRAFVEEPGIADPDDPAKKVVRAVLHKQDHRVRRAVRRLDGSDDAYHAVRKAARRMRYVAEAGSDAAVEVSGAEDLAAAGERVHDVLGAHRDAVLVAEQIARRHVLAVRAGEPGEPYLRIEALAREDAAARLAELPGALRSLRKAGSALG